MQPSSLIFVLVVAIWAVYLLQYWIKRRDHLSTVRSVDRFSAAMRVLDEHRMGRGTAEPTPRSYSVAPTRAARPEVTVKHAEAPPARLTPTVRPEPIAGPSRRLRGLVLLTTAVLLPVVAVFAIVTPLPWWAPIAWLGTTVASFAWLRRAVVAERSAGRRVRVQRASEPARPVARAGAPEATTASAEPASSAESAPAAVTPAARSTRVYDIAQEQPPVAEESTEAAVAEPAAAAEPGTWQPTPVPPPMYTMKAKAERPEPAPMPAATTPADEVPQVIDVEDEDLPAIAGWG